MLNARPIDKKFWVSGGWQNIERDIKWLKEKNIRAILDLQYTPNDDSNIFRSIQRRLSEEGIRYHYISMYDGDYNSYLSSIFLEGEGVLELWDTTFTGKKDRILVKCGAGASRSVSQYLNYICYRDRLDLQTAFTNFRNAEDAWAKTYSDYNYWPASPDEAFIYYLSNKYPINKSAFGEINRE